MISQHMEFDHKSALRVRLLVEETFAMVNTITEEFFGMVDAPIAPGAPLQMDNIVWTLDACRQGVDEAKEKSEDVKEVWDELEKSILANLADDLIVAIRGDEAEITVVKKFSKAHG